MVLMTRCQSTFYLKAVVVVPTDSARWRHFSVKPIELPRLVSCIVAASLGTWSTSLTPPFVAHQTGY